MKKIIFLILMVLTISSCMEENIYGQYGIVTAIESVNVNEEGKHYSYKVEVHHHSYPNNGYCIYTNINYNVGDTIKIQ